MLPNIRVTCEFCGAKFTCEPDDLFGYDDDEPIYACNDCQYKNEQDAIDSTYTQDFDTFTDADPGL